METSLVYTGRTSPLTLQSSRKKLRVGVSFGGTFSEHDVSCGSTQVELGFTWALEREGIDEQLSTRQAQLQDGWHGPRLPVLLVMSDNGPQMRSGDTAEFMALSLITRHFATPATPTDQAIRRPELAIVGEHYNDVRLHEGIGYVTPNDEHDGRGETIRKARQDGMKTAHQRRLATNRTNRHS